VDKIRCGVIGLGAMGRNHAMFIKESQIGELTSLCDVDRHALRKAAERFQVEKTYTDFHEMLKDPSLDMISLCLPHYLHSPVGIEALKAGKHVLTEKPIAINLKEADKMIEAAKENDVKLGVAEEHRYAGQIQLAKKWIGEGRIGKPYLCSCTERFGGWEPRSWGWRSKSELIGGGSFIDQGHHAVDIIRYVMGDPYECCAYMVRPTGALEGEEITLAIYKHAGGAISQVHAGWAPGPARFTLSIYGLKGTIMADRIRASGSVLLFAPLRKNSNRQGTSANQPIEKVEVAGKWRYTWKYVAIEKFLNAILKDARFEYSGEEGKKNLAAILAAYESSRRGVSIKIKYD